MSVFYVKLLKECAIVRVMIYKAIPNPSIQIIPEEFILSEDPSDSDSNENKIDAI